MRGRILSVYAIALLLGALTGTIGSLFQLSIAWLSGWCHWLIGTAGMRSGLLMLFVSISLSAVLALIAWIMVVDVAPEASGSGVQEIEGALLNERPVFWRRLLPVKFAGGVLAISANLVLGREGPTIQMGGNLGDMLGEYFHLKRQRRNTLIAAGAAAGLATAFNAPLAGVLFVIEEMRNQFNFNFTNFKMVALCCVMATITTHMILGADPAIPMTVFAAPSLKSLIVFFIFGLVVGLAGWFFNVLLMQTLKVTDTLTLKKRLCYVTIVGAFIGFLTIIYPESVGGGYEIIERSLTMTPSLSWLLPLIIMRFFTTFLSYNTSVPGGIFAPMLALGTLMGLASHKILIYWLPDLGTQPGMFAVAGMGALFSAAVRAPVTGIVLVVEMTQNYSLILPLMVSCLTSTTVIQLANNEPIYTQLLRRTLKRQRVMKKLATQG